MTDPAEDIDEIKEPSFELDDATPRRVSFFASSAILDTDLRDHAAWIEIEEADEAVCARVWEIFAKDSTARGFDARSARSKRASAALALRWAKDGTAAVREAARDKNLKEMTMDRSKGEDGLTTKQRAVLVAWRDLTAKGAPFNNGDVARLAGITGSSPESVSANVSVVMKRLRASGMFETLATTPEKRGGATPKPKPTAKPKASKPAAPREGRAKAGSEAAADPLISELVARRDAAAAQVTKLDAAIAAVRAAS